VWYKITEVCSLKIELLSAIGSWFVGVWMWLTAAFRYHSPVLTSRHCKDCEPRFGIIECANCKLEKPACRFVGSQNPANRLPSSNVLAMRDFAMRRGCPKGSFAPVQELWHPIVVTQDAMEDVCRTHVRCPECDFGCAVETPGKEFSWKETARLAGGRFCPNGTTEYVPPDLSQITPLNPFFGISA